MKKNTFAFIVFIMLTITIISITNFPIYKNTLYITLEPNKLNFVEYNGTIEFLTFNTLMAFPDKALNNNNPLKTIYNETKLTPNEFKNIILTLYKNNYIIVDIDDIINQETMEQKILKLPQNKKPILLSFDNVNYSNNYQNLGEIDKIIIDRNNNIATYSTKQSIQDRVNYDNEFIVIIEEFIKKHPDFSLNNAKGIIFLSGENGILGYNTNHKNAGNKQDIKRVSELIFKIKSLGWKFGCNNYKYKDENTKSEIEFAKDLSLWNSEIKPLIGETSLYSYPYGIKINNNIKKDLLITDGFKIFFSNNTKSTLSLHGNICLIERIPINGKTLRENPKELSHLFDCKTTYDKEFRKIPIS